MRLSRLNRLALPACLLVLGLLPAAAAATPVTVQLRVEGSEKTLYEGPVSTEAASFEAPSSDGVHPCSYSENGAAGGEFTNGGSPAGTPTSALRDAALASGLSFDAEWFGSGTEGNENPGDFFVTQVGGDVNQSSPPFASWGYAVDFTTAPVGGCEIALAPGNEVLWAYNYFNLEHRLRLTGPASVEAGVPFTVKVSDGSSGVAIPGAAIGSVSAGVTTTLAGSAATGAGGEATIVLPADGSFTLKARQEGAVRSNGLAVCVHTGEDGMCGTSFPKGPPPKAFRDRPAVVGIAAGHVYGRHAGPRILRGSVTVPDGGTLSDVRISLARQAGKRCFLFSGTRGQFARAGCEKTRFFSVGSSETFSYLLPARLPAGRYVFEIEALDASGNVTSLEQGVSRVVFRVR